MNTIIEIIGHPATTNIVYICLAAVSCLAVQSLYKTTVELRKITTKQQETILKLLDISIETAAKDIKK